jgi:hypothetical protein
MRFNLIRVPSLLSIRLVNKSILSEGFSYKLPIALFFSYLSFKTPSFWVAGL